MDPPMGPPGYDQENLGNSQGNQPSQFTWSEPLTYYDASQGFHSQLTQPGPLDSGVYPPEPSYGGSYAGHLASPFGETYQQNFSPQAPVRHHPYHSDNDFYMPLRQSNPQTIAPGALQRSDQAQNMGGSYQNQSGSGQGYAQQYNFAEQNPPPDGTVSFPHGPSQAPTLSQGAVSHQERGLPSGRGPIQEPARASTKTWRITHPELMAEAENDPTRRIVGAPFLVLEPLPVESKSSQVKTRVKKLAKDPGGKGPIPGVGSPTAPSDSKPAKLTTSTTKSSSANTARTQKNQRSSQVVAESKSTAPFSSDASSSSNEESSSSEGSGDEVDRPTMEPEQLSSVRSEVRPSDPVLAAAWDATGIVFVSRHRHATRSEVSKAQLEYLKFLVELRDGWKNTSAELATAESAKNPDAVKVLRAAQTLKRDAMRSAIRATIDNGHHEIKAYFGKNEKLVAAMFSILRECAKLRDFDSDLPATVFELISQFEPLTEDLLLRVKYDSVEKRFLNSENTKPEVKGFINAIRSKDPKNAGRTKNEEQNAAQAENKKVVGGAQENLKADKVEAPSKSKSSNSGLKRPRESDASSSKSNKKNTSEVRAAGQNQKPFNKPRTTNLFDGWNKPGARTSGSARATNVSTVASTTNALTANAPTMNAPTTNAPTTNTPAANPNTQPETTSQPQGGIGRLLDSINNPKPKPVEVPKPLGPPETTEEKATREHKETRRRLRVRFREGSDLVEIKWFVAEEAEVERREENEIMDAHDGKSEGETLKHRVLDKMDEEEDDGPGEVEFRPYPELELINLGSEIKGARAEMNYVTRGGEKPVSSTQQVIQNRREAVEVMLVFTDPADIPPSGKEPPQENYDTGHTEREFGRPSAPWFQDRIQEIHRYEGEGNARKHEKHQSLSSSSSLDVTSFLDSLKIGHSVLPLTHYLGHQQSFPHLPSSAQKSTLSNQQQLLQPQGQDDPQQDRTFIVEMDPDDLARLEANFSRYKGLPVPVTEPPYWLTGAKRAEWLEGYNRDKAAAERRAGEEQSALVQSQAQKLPVHPQASFSQVQTPQTPYSQFQTQAQYPAMGAYPVPSAATTTVVNTSDPAMLEYARSLLDAATKVQGNENLPVLQPTAAAILTSTPGQASAPYDPTNLQSVLASLHKSQSNPVTSAPYDPTYLQSILASLDKAQGSTTPSQLPGAFAGINYGQSNPSQPEPQQSWPGAWSVANVGNSGGQAYSAQNQNLRWDTTTGGASVVETTRTNYAENPRSTYETTATDNQSRGRDGGHGTEDRSRSNNPSDYKRNTKPCKFWKEGKCVKGSSCTYQHF